MEETRNYTGEIREVCDQLKSVVARADKLRKEVNFPVRNEEEGEETFEEKIKFKIACAGALTAQMEADKLYVKLNQIKLEECLYDIGELLKEWRKESINENV